MTPKTKNAAKFLASFVATAVVFGALVFYVLIPYMKKDIGPDQTAEFRLMQIAKAYQIFMQNAPGHVLPAQPGDSAHEAALLFAKQFGLTESQAWMVDNDPMLFAIKVPRLLIVETLGEPILDPVFARLPLGVALAANVSLASPPTTPIAWTRGLQPDGTWSADSPFSGLGGYVAFLDGHIQWFTQLDGKKGASLVKFGTHTPTADIREALPPGAVILRGYPKRLTDEVTVPAAP